MGRRRAFPQPRSGPRGPQSPCLAFPEDERHLGSGPARAFSGASPRRTVRLHLDIPAPIAFHSREHSAAPPLPAGRPG
ncbi:hypothetical protein RMHFA_04246 [Roseomonas mucosa]|nr:hypothetical protein RMHFA_04246 [Roseomonas mucosa]